MCLGGFTLFLSLLFILPWQFQNKYDLHDEAHFYCSAFVSHPQRSLDHSMNECRLNIMGSATLHKTKPSLWSWVFFMWKLYSPLALNTTHDVFTFHVENLLRWSQELGPLTRAQLWGRLLYLWCIAMDVCTHFHVFLRRNLNNPAEPLTIPPTMYSLLLFVHSLSNIYDHIPAELMPFLSTSTKLCVLSCFKKC